MSEHELWIDCGEPTVWHSECAQGCNGDCFPTARATCWCCRKPADVISVNDLGQRAAACHGCEAERAAEVAS